MIKSSFAGTKTCPSGYSMGSNGYCHSTTDSAGKCPPGGHWSGGNTCTAEPITTPPKTSSTAKPNTASTPNAKTAQAMTMPKMFGIPKSLKTFDVETIPEDILDNSNLTGWVQNIAYMLIIFGFIYDMYMNLYRFSIGDDGKNKSYWQLFFRLIFAFTAVYIWSKGIFFEQYLNFIQNTQDYIWTTMANKSNVYKITADVRHMIGQFGSGQKGNGFEWYNPATWGNLVNIAGQAVLEFIFATIVFLVYIIYIVVYFLIYLFQVLILGLLYAIFPLAIGLWVGEYAESVSPLQSWFKWFIEVSTWGVFIGLENVIFNTIVGNFIADSVLGLRGGGVKFSTRVGSDFSHDSPASRRPLPNP
ncbi:MAG: hypothetical protein M1276_03990 [Deltaproteobacteria bacterium]|nr:hypothetical protein [Deltaproteobacteria bacterium]